MADSKPPAPRGRDDRPRDDEAEQRRLTSAALGSGLQFVVSILVFLYAGQWLDRRFGTGSLFTLLGVLLGAGGAFYSLYRRLMAAQRPPDDRSVR